MDTKRKMRSKLNSNNKPRFEDGVIKLKLNTNSHQDIWVNMLLIQKIQDFFKTSDKPEEQVDLSFYTYQARKKYTWIHEPRSRLSWVHCSDGCSVEITTPWKFLECLEENTPND